MGDARGVTLWTVGHSSRPWEEFLSLLRPERIEVIADVRRHAGSRKHPQYGPGQLPSGLAAAGIDYVPLPELGGRRRPRPDSPNTVWRNPSFRGYADHMESEEYARGRERLLRIAAERRAALLCSEAVWWRCHRALIADDIKAAGARVLHVMAAGKTAEHPDTAAASVRGGVLRYDEPAADREAE